MKQLTIKLVIYRSLMTLFISCSVYVYGQDSSQTNFSGSDIQKRSIDSIDSDTIIHFYGVTTCLDSSHQTTLLPYVMITAVDIHNDAVMVNSNDFAYYDLSLKQNNKYRIYYEYKGMYAQFLELNTRDGIVHPKKSEYLLPSHTIMSLNENPKVKAFYLENSTEKIFWEPESKVFVKDKLYSDSFEAELKQIQKD